MAKFYTYMTVIVTASVLAWFFALTVSPHPQVRLASEQRLSNPLPEPPSSFRHFPQFARRLDGYLNDGMPYRSDLVRWRSIMRLSLFHAASSNRVVAGKDDWLFLAENDLRYYRNDFPFQEKELKQWVTALQARSDWLKQRGVPYLFVVAPSKATIYPQYLPVRYNKVRPDSRCDQLSASLLENSDIDFLDLRPQIKQAQTDSKDLLYYKTDTHWNSLGGLVASQAILKRVNELLPDVNLAVPEVKVEAGTYTGDLAVMLNLDGVLEERVQKARIVKPEANVVLNLTKTNMKDASGAVRSLISRHPDQNLPRALVLRDSFSTALQPYLSENFSEAVYCWQHNLRASMIEKHRPEIVIEVYCERFLMDEVPRNNFDLPGSKFLAGLKQRDK